MWFPRMVSKGKVYSDRCISRNQNKERNWGKVTPPQPIDTQNFEVAEKEATDKKSSSWPGLT